jgi:adenylate kinase
MKTFILFFGPPGSGKGTQSDMLASALRMPVVSPGELLRHEEETGTELGKKIAPLIDSGQFVPDAMIEEMLRNRLSKEDAANGAVLDGYPRTEEQLGFFLTNFVGAEDRTLAVLIDVDDAEVMKRLSGRRVCDCGASYHLEYNPPKTPDVCDLCGKELEIRHDDKPEIMAKRLEMYHQGVRPLLKHWEESGRLVRLDGAKPVEEVHEEIKAQVVKISR